MTTKRKLRDSDVAAFHEAAKSSLDPNPSKIPAHDIWEEIEFMLKHLEKDHPWKVRRVRASFRWLFMQVQVYESRERKANRGH